MKDLLRHHPDDRVIAAAIALLDALCSWERSTGRHNVVIIKDSIGVQYRSFDGAPQPENISDVMMLDAFDCLAKQEL